MRMDHTHSGDAAMSTSVTIWCMAILHRCEKIPFIRRDALKQIHPAIHHNHLSRQISRVRQHQSDISDILRARASSHGGIANPLFANGRPIFGQRRIHQPRCDSVHPDFGSQGFGELSG